MGTLPVQQLSPKQKKISQRKYLFFSVFNTLSFVTVTDNMLILFALKMGASDFSIAILAALGYLTMPAMVLGKMLTNKVGITRTFGLGWIFSGLVAGLLLLAPTVSEHFSSLMAIILISLAAGGYHFFRNIGITAMTPLLGEITSRKDQGNYLSRLWMTANFALLFITAGNAFILGNTPSTTVFLRIIAVGILAELTAAYIMFSIPTVPGPETKETEKLAETARYIWQNKTLRHFFLCWLLLSSGMALTGPFNVLAMKKGYLFSEKTVILITLISVAGGIMVSFINRLLLDRVGPRPMLFLYTAGLALSNFLWAIAPTEPSYYHIILIFLLAGICINGINTSLYFYLLNRTPEKKRMNTSILIYMISGIFTALMSSFAGGGLLNLLRALSLTGLRVYQFYFLVVGVYQIIVASQVYRLEPLQDRK
ncbi:MFS transporter, partial [bacterium]|nr:MFS transporter [bacterium]